MAPITTSSSTVRSGVIATTTSTTTTTTTKKGSAFVGLLPPKQQVPTNGSDETGFDFDTTTSAAANGQSLPNWNFLAKIAQKSRIQGTSDTATRGGDFSHYRGEYGEDGMDVDFAGQLEDGDDDDNKAGVATSKKKKNKQAKGEESTTMAMREYGKRGKPMA